MLQRRVTFSDLLFCLDELSGLNSTNSGSTESSNFSNALGGMNLSLQTWWTTALIYSCRSAANSKGVGNGADNNNRRGEGRIVWLFAGFVK